MPTCFFCFLFFLTSGARAAKASSDQRLADAALHLATSAVERQQLAATVRRLNETAAALEADVKAAKLAAEAARHGRFSNEEMSAVLEDELAAERARAAGLELDLAAGAEREAASADELQRALAAAEELKAELKAAGQARAAAAAEGQGQAPQAPLEPLPGGGVNPPLTQRQADEA